MIRAGLILLTIVDLGLAALLVGVSGFMFGHGPESMKAGVLFGFVYFGFVALCIAAPVLAFIVQSRGKTGLAFGLALGPPIGALLAAMIPAPY